MIDNRHSVMHTTTSLSDDRIKNNTMLMNKVGTCLKMTLANNKKTKWRKLDMQIFQTFR